MIGTSDLREGCFKCGPDHSAGGHRPRLVPRATWIVCEKCGGSYGEATPENIKHLAAAPQVLSDEARARASRCGLSPALLVI